MQRLFWVNLLKIKQHIKSCYAIETIVTKTMQSDTEIEQHYDLGISWDEAQKA